MCKRTILLPVLLLNVLTMLAQEPADSILEQASLEACVAYAISNQPDMRQVQMDQDIAEHSIKGKLADWYPQIGLNYNLQHYLQLPVTVLPDFNNPGSGERREVRMGVSNQSTIAFALNQNLFNRDLLLASNTARDVRNQAQLNVKNNKINVTVNVSKAFYDLLLTISQQDIGQADVVRLERGLKDATSQYEGGMVDKTDFKRATIALNNSKATLKRTEELIKAKYVTLKNAMGYPAAEPLEIVADSLEIDAATFLDTTQTLNYQNRIEYELLTNQKALSEANLQYSRNAYVPSLSAFINYNLNYLSEEFRDLYGSSFPNSLFGVTLALPIFQGGRRSQNVKVSKLQLSRLDWDFVRLKNAVDNEYSSAMANYKANLNDYAAAKENEGLAQEVYDVIQLQYKGGVKMYLDVIIAQNDLQTAQFNLVNALYTLVSSKIDVDKSLGIIQ